MQRAPTSASPSTMAAAAPRSARAAGFTLIEMLLVLSIMGILMGISIGAFRHAIPAQSLARNAVIDALRQAGVTHFDMPATPQRLWAAIRAAKEGKPRAFAIG